MATIKELHAKFSANQSGMDSAFTAIANRLNDIEKASDRAARNIEKNMTRGMNRVFKTGEGFEKVGSTFTNISKKSEEVGSNLTNKITKPAMIAGGALASITIGKGFGRLVEIDNAKAKLDGLGHSSESVQKIMDNALESVRGTSFGLGEAATTASSAVAAGIKPGKELTRYLSLTGDAAAIAGSSMGEMGSIINKVQTSNKAYNGELQQLSERGIPIYQWIAKEAGVTADEVFKMASDGEISSKMFLNAIETNIGGAAKKMGQKSFTASLANMWAAVGRLGASFLDAGGKGGGFFSKMKPLMNDLTTAIDGMEGSAAKWGETLGQVLDKVVNGIKGIVNWYNSLDKSTQKLIASIMQWSTLILVGLGPVLMIFSKLTGIIGAIFGPFGKFLKFFAKFSTAAKSSEGAIIGITKVFPKLGAILGTLTGPIGWITLGVIALGTAFIVAYKKSETFRNIVNAVLNGVKQTFITIGNIIKGFFQLFKGNGQDGVITLSKILPPNVVVGLTNFATKVKTTFFQVVNAISTFARSIGTQISAFWSKNGAEITQAVKNIGNVISTVFKFIWSYVIKPIMTLIWNLMKLLWPAIKMLVVSVWNNIKGVIQGATNIILGIIKVFSSLLTGNWKGVWQGIVQILKGAVVLAWNLVQLWFVGKILKVVKVGLGLLRGVVSKGWTFIRNFIGKTAQSIWNSVKQKFLGLNKSIQSITTSIKNWLSNTWALIKNKVVALAQILWTNVRAKFTGLFKSVKNIFNSIRNFAVNLWTNLKNKVTSIAQNLWNNIKSKFNGLFSSVKGILNKTLHFSSNSWKSIKNSAVNMAKTMKDSVVNTFGKMKNGIKGFVNGIKDMVIGMKNSVVENSKKLASGIKEHTIGGLNKMIGGVNKVGDKLGLGKEMIKPIKLSTGTRNGAIAEDTMAIVGDKGKGNGPKGFRHETIRYPNGKTVITPDTDTLAYLPKGTVVENGTQTYASINNLPRYSDGTSLTNKLGKASGKFLGKQANKHSKTIKKVSDGVEGVKTAGKAAGKVVKDKFDSVIGDVFDYMENPGKLVDKVMDMMGVDFSGIKAVPGQMMGKMYKKLTGGVKKMFSKWFEETSGGDIDGSGILSKGVSYGYSPNKPLPGYPLSINGGRHYGIDTPHVFDKIQAPMSGKATKQHDVGGGNILRLAAGKIAMYFVHLSKILKEGMVKKGETIAVTGNSGANTTGPHLHTQVEEGPTPFLTNTNTLDPVKVLKGMGGNTKGSNYKSTIIRALKLAGLPVTPAYINAWSKQIMTESGGNAKAMGGNDGLSDGNAMGLVQVKPGTFSAYKGKGMGNIWNPLHNLVAGMNYAKNTYGSRLLGTIGQGHGYAEGGIINSPEIAWLAEGGFSESVISHDPSMKARSKVIWDRTGEMLGFSEEAELLRGIYSAINEGNNLQSINNRDTNRIANKDTKVFLDSKEITKKVNNNQGNMARNAGYNLGMSGV
ncbi:tape measure protein [Mammaliicoccus sciuri]|uniref:tape measure protein n=1 Tax=Mammaliicoccus sciuri TaxID=1296 RepID=UPI002DBE238E|nr:tape measure protein [Mammaliicoccus sciuri]MEB7050065.1 tape measure protein [Mammaliicoccus sciuri]